MQYLTGFMYSLASSMTLTSPPLYRYPYRSTPEAFRSDWKNVGKDIEAAQRSFDGMRGEAYDE